MEGTGLRYVLVILRMYGNKNIQSGFTLLELMIVVSVIGVLAVVGLPAYQDYLFRAKLPEMALHMDSFKKRLYEYRSVYGVYPPDTHVDPPAEVSMPEYWYEETLLGGNYNWEGPDGYPYAGISILGATAEERHIVYFDRMLDDGNLSTGTFRLTPNGRYTWILEE